MIENKQFTVLQLLPYLGPFIILLGVIRLMCFYNAFGISVIDFLDFSEIVTSFLDITAFIIFVLLYAVVQGVLFNNPEQEKSLNSQFELLLEEKRTVKLITLYFRYLSSLLIFLLFIDVILVICNLYFHSVSSYELLITNYIFLALIFFIIVIVEIERKHKIKNSTLNNRRFIYLVLRVMVLLVIVANIATYQVHGIKVNKSHLGITVYLDDNSVLKSDSNNYYIGNTKNYLFYYHEKTKTSDVYPINKIKQLTFINKSY